MQKSCVSCVASVRCRSWPVLRHSRGIATNDTNDDYEESRSEKSLSLRELNGTAKCIIIKPVDLLATFRYASCFVPVTTYNFGCLRIH
ncbi:hypothetical protein LIA77_06182 [Sarocladium implicatum]|nr:hypothetical protein LIA77_06182 [Sarocladium implicatum]